MFPDALAASRSEWDVTEPYPFGEPPALVLHAAAWTDVDGAEGDPDGAAAVNVAGTRNVVRLGAPVVYYSTDYVFDGRKREPYVESDPTAPLGEYGRSKLAGEAEVREGWIVRSSWLFGATGHNFVRTMLRLGEERDEVAVVDDQRGSPTYVDHLAQATEELLERPGGVWHLAAEGDCTWADFAEAIFEEAGLDCRVRRITTAEFPRPARRPAYSVLRSEREGAPRLPHWREGLRACLARLRSQLGFRPVRILVTGGAGFIGSHFVRRLAARGVEVVVLDKLTYSGNLANLEGVEHRFVEGDIADPEAVASSAQGCEAIVNFAAESHVDRSILESFDFVHTQVHGTQTLLEHVRDTGVRFVQVSTDEVYGDLEGGGSSTEDDPLRPSSPYSATKAGGDLLVLGYARTHGVNASITRGANTYGPNQYPEKFLPLFITNALDGEPLPVYGDGRQRREWLHVDDHCAAIELVLEHGRAGETYNVGGDERENLEMVRRILDLTGADESLVRHVTDRPGHDRRYSIDDARLRSLGWAPNVGLEDGLSETFGWYRDNRTWWEPIKSGEYRAYYQRQYADRLAQEGLAS